MSFTSTRIPYRQTNAFSTIALDHIDQATALKPFISQPPTLQGIQKAIENRKKFTTDRKSLVKVLTAQYDGVTTTQKVKKNIDSLLSTDTFTVTTAHQNNIFTGPLYFIYKILHAIKLADHLNESLTGQKFVPVFYMGTEDADLDELNHINLGGEKLVWSTKQTGAVGRMKIDKDLLKLMDKMVGQLSVLPKGEEFVSLLRSFYKEGRTIQDATFQFVNHLFGEFGLVVLLPDHPLLKKQMTSIFRDDLLHQKSSAIVDKSISRLEEAGYKIQANPREINLFYLQDNIRERIEKRNGHFNVVNTKISFDESSIVEELGDHPEKFSPNVILRGIYQETILPNIAFIGGAGELAYWLQLKDLFDHYKIPFPSLVLRNSFLIVENKWREKISKLGFTIEDFFLPEQELMSRLVARESKNDTKLNGPLSELEKMYEAFKKQAALVDITLEKHVDALKLRTVDRLHELEKKMLRAEKRKFSDQQRQIHTIKNTLFPDDGLQERSENLSYFYAKWGHEFIKELYQHSLHLEQEFVILAEK